MSISEERSLSIFSQHRHIKTPESLGHSVFRHGNHLSIIITTSRIVRGRRMQQKSDRKGLTSLFGQLVEEFVTGLDNTTHAGFKLVSRLTTGDLIHCA